MSANGNSPIAKYHSYHTWLKSISPSISLLKIKSKSASTFLRYLGIFHQMANQIHRKTWLGLKLSPHQKEAPLAYDDKQLALRAVSYRGKLGGDGGMLNPHDKALPSVCLSRACHLPESHSTLLVISQVWEAQSSTLLSTPKISWRCWSTAALCPHCPPFTELPLPPGLRVVNGVAQFLIVPIFASVNSRLYNCHHQTKTYFTTRHPLSAKN